MTIKAYCIECREPYFPRRKGQMFCCKACKGKNEKMRKKLQTGVAIEPKKLLHNSEENNALMQRFVLGKTG